MLLYAQEGIHNTANKLHITQAKNFTQHKLERKWPDFDTDGMPEAQNLGNQRYRWDLCFFIGPDPKNDALDPKVEFSDRKIQNIFNHRKEHGHISTPLSSQKLRIWGIKDLGEIYLFLLALTPKMRLWT